MKAIIIHYTVSLVFIKLVIHLLVTDFTKTEQEEVKLSLFFCTTLLYRYSHWKVQKGSDHNIFLWVRSHYCNDAVTLPSWIALHEYLSVGTEATLGKELETSFIAFLVRLSVITFPCVLFRNTLEDRTHDQHLQSL